MARDTETLLSKMEQILASLCDEYLVCAHARFLTYVGNGLANEIVELGPTVFKALDSRAVNDVLSGRMRAAVSNTF
jgi:hypothetical protein